MRETRKALIDLLDEFPVQMEWHDNADLANYLLSNGVDIPVRCKDCFADECCSVQIDLNMGGDGYCPKGRRKDNA